MNAQCPSLAIPSAGATGDFSVIAARLVEAACFARDGNCEAAKAQIARAMTLLRGEPGSIPANFRPFNADAPNIAPGRLTTWQKRRLTAHIDAHLAEKLLVADLARLLGLSESYFSRAFRCTFETSAHQYITRRRIEVAQSLLLTSRLSLCEIALQCGLSDQSQFSRLFRRMVGESPFAWRRTRSAEIKDRTTEPSTSPTGLAAVSSHSVRPEQQY